MRKVLLSLCALAMGAGSVAAQESPLWLRQSSISPDGTKIVFAWQGDIFTVDSKGGTALQITSNPAHESDPMWTPDGKNIVFASTREKSKDIWITSALGGESRRITDFPGSETPLTVTRDGTILFSSSFQYDTDYSGFPNTAQLYGVSTEGGRPFAVTSLPISNLSVNSRGAALYEDNKGYEDKMRKHHTSSVTRDIWLYTPVSTPGERYRIDGKGTFTKLSTFVGEDRNPVFAADGDTYYYISEKNGSFNIYKSSVSEPSAETRITSFDTHPVRYISVAENGTLAFSYDGELYTVREGEAPSKVKISIVKDKIDRDLTKTSVSSVKAMAVSPSGKEVAVVSRGDVYVTSVEYRTTKRITNTPEQERDVCFSKDGRTVYYSAERNGHWGIYATSLTDKKDEGFTYAFKMEEKMITSPGQTCFQPSVSPDGEWLAFLRDRSEIVIRNLKNGKEKSLLKGVNYSYSDGDLNFEWSPDSRYILTDYQGNGGWNNSDVALIEIESGEITDLTRSGYTDSNFRWAMKGKAMTWQSDKAGYRSHGSWGAEDDVYVMFFDWKTFKEFKQDEEDEVIEGLLNPKEKEKEQKKEEKKDSTETDKKVEKLVLNLDNLEDRTLRLTKFSGRMGDYYLTNDGKKLFYVVRSAESVNLYVMDTKKGEIKLVSKGMLGSITPSADGKYIYMNTILGITRIDTGSEARKRISFSGEFEYRPAEEREYIFNHVWKQVKDKFYDKTIHGIDWEGYKEAYAKFLPHINNNYDFTEMLSEMLGELNGSHTGARYSASAGTSMACLGVIYDPDYEGDGLKIKEVLPSGVIEIADPEIKAGDIITAIDGKPIKASESWFDLLAGKAGKKVMLSIKKGGKKPVDIYVEPVSVSSERELMYKRWVRNNEAKVEALSGGKVGYVHVKGMNSDSFREVYSKLLGKYRGCQAVIVDTRSNGGGWLHDDLATLLDGKAYIRFEPRGQYIGTEPYSKWTKPSCVLMGEDNYSDACGFPYVYKTLGIGKLIGAPVPGTMTAVWWETQIDPTIVFGIPQVGSIGIKEGRYLENFQIEPDITVYNDPASLLNGEDRQLEAAVEEMLKTINDK